MGIFETKSICKRETLCTRKLNKEVPIMIALPRRFARGAFVLLILAATSSGSVAQETRNRELTPLADFAMVQAPVAITSVKLNGKEIQPGEKIKGNDDWLRGV